MIKKKYRANKVKPKLKKKKVKLKVSSVAAISTVSIFVFKGRPKRKSRLCVPLSPLYIYFLNGPGRAVMCSLYIYTASQY